MGCRFIWLWNMNYKWNGKKISWSFQNVLLKLNEINKLGRKSREWRFTDPSRRNKIHMECNKATTMRHDWSRTTPWWSVASHYSRRCSGRPLERPRNSYISQFKKDAGINTYSDLIQAGWRSRKMEDDVKQCKPTYYRLKKKRNCYK